MAKIRWLCSCLECFIGIIVFIFISESFGDRTREKIYINLKGNMPCFRRLNATHQTGCTSKRGGSVGILHFVEDSKEGLEGLNGTLMNGSTPPYVVALPYTFFNRTTLINIRESGKVSGVLLLYPENATPSADVYAFSSDKVCPNSNYGMYREGALEDDCNERPWNAFGQNIMFEDWGFPIFIIRKEEDIDSIQKCYEKFNSDNSSNAGKWPYCAAELRSYMLAAKDTQTCIRRSHLHTNISPVTVCDPLGDQNIWMTVTPTNKTSPLADNSTVVVATRMDAASLFDSWSPGAHTAVTGLITLLAVAEALNRHKHNFTDGKTVLFTIFTGESFDYIGSSRMVYEMERNNFPVSLDKSVGEQPSLIKLSTISHFLELSQLSYTNDSLYMHVDKTSSESERLQKLLTQNGKHYNLSFYPSNRESLPPASLQSFLRKNKNIAGIVLADHDNRYVNRFYNSLFDVHSGLMSSWNEDEKIFEQLADVSSAVAETIYSLVSNNKSVPIKVNSTFIRSLMVCYLNNSNCPLFLSSMDPDQVKNIQKSFDRDEKTCPLYVSVDTYVNTITSLTLQLLAYLTGETLPNVLKPECIQHREGQIFRYFWMSPKMNGTDGICVKSTVNFSKAVSPAFEIDDYNFTSGEFSTWTESVWETSSVRIFLKPSQEWEFTVLVTGIVIFIVSFVIVWFFNRNAVMLFARSQVGC